MLGAPTTWTEVWPFLAAGIPGINVSTFTSEFDRSDYHTQYDTSDRVDFDYLERLTHVCARLLLEACKKHGSQVAQMLAVAAFAAGGSRLQITGVHLAFDARQVQAALANANGGCL